MENTEGVPVSPFDKNVRAVTQDLSSPVSRGQEQRRRSNSREAASLEGKRQSRLREGRTGLYRAGPQSYQAVDVHCSSAMGRMTLRAIQRP